MTVAVLLSQWKPNNSVVICLTSYYVFDAIGCNTTKSVALQRTEMGARSQPVFSS